MLTNGQTLILVFVTELMIYSFFSKCLDTIKYCYRNRNYMKALKNGIITIEEYQELWIKANKED